ncbi:hypothetical protein VTO42DRAFT_3467 [Malbranchea cinnamomea]
MASQNNIPDLLAFVREACKGTFEHDADFYSGATSEVNAALHRLPSTLRRVAASSLTESDAIEIFGLKVTPDPVMWNLSDWEAYNPPQHLMDSIAELKYALNDSPSTKPYATCFAKLILFSCLTAERQIYEYGNCCACGPAPQRVWPLKLQLDTELGAQVPFRSQQVVLCGFLDATLWQGRSNDLGSNTVLVEVTAKGRSTITGASSGNLIAAMGNKSRYVSIIPSVPPAVRSSGGRHNTTAIYGISTDGNHFGFYRLDPEGRIARSRVCDWEYSSEERTLIMSSIRQIIRGAVTLNQEW